MGLFTRKRKKLEFPSPHDNQREKEIIVPTISQEYESIMRFYNISKSYVDNDDELDMVRKHLLSLIKREWKYAVINKDLYYPDEVHGRRDISIPLEGGSLEDGTEWSCPKISNGREVDLSQDILLTFPWNWQKLFSTAITIGKEPFYQHEDNHIGYYFRYMDFGYMVNGFHSVAAGIAFGKGKLILTEIDDAPIFKHIDTDGVWWYDALTRDKLVPVGDYREALVFQLTKEKIKYNEGEIDNGIT